MHTAADLARADRHVSEAEARIEWQRELIAKLKVIRSDTKDAEVLLANMLDLLTEMMRHRDEIAADVKRGQSPAI